MSAHDSVVNIHRKMLIKHLSPPPCTLCLLRHVSELMPKLPHLTYSTLPPTRCALRAVPCPTFPPSLPWTPLPATSLPWTPLPAIPPARCAQRFCRPMLLGRLRVVQAPTQLNLFTLNILFLEDLGVLVRARWGSFLRASDRDEAPEEPREEAREPWEEREEGRDPSREQLLRGEPSCGGLGPVLRSSLGVEGVEPLGGEVLWEVEPREVEARVGGPHRSSGGEPEPRSELMDIVGW